MKICITNTKIFTAFYVVFFQLFNFYFVHAQSLDQNYVRIRIPLTQISDELSLNTNSAEIDKVSTTIQYIDDLGRPLQNLILKGSPNYNDIVQPYAYDAFGREQYKYLPYSSNINNGSYKSDALEINTGLRAFYNSSNPGVKPISTPFAETRFENSLLNRVKEQGYPGNEWQPGNRTSNSGRTVLTEYLSNTNSAGIYPVRFYSANPVTVSGNEHHRALGGTGYYSANELFLTIIKDENWINGRAGIVEEYKDKDGKIVLKRTWQSETTKLSTYYIYDDLGNLSFVLPPGVNPDNNSNPISSVIDDFAFQYRYDGWNRLIEKKSPGKGWEYIVYNKLDQVVATQDQVQLAKKQWSFTKYDALGRLVMSGWWDNGNIAINRRNLQALIDNESLLWESRLSSGEYANNSWPMNAVNFYTVNYYDNYTVPGFPVNYSFTNYSENAQSLQVKGLLTVSKNWSSNSSTTLWSVYYYDQYGRVIQNHIGHHLVGKDVTNYIYNFIGQVIKTQRDHTGPSGQSLSILNNYFYDHQGRLISNKQKTGTDAEVILFQNTYNELGQVIDKKLHSLDAGANFLQSIDYRYNARGWLNNINNSSLNIQPGVNDDSNDQFGMEINYQNALLTQFNGNIGQMTWKTSRILSPKLSYDFRYDKLNRLIEAVSTSNGVKDGSYSEYIQYDVMGNIQSLGRYGKINNKQQIDSLRFIYSGNRYIRIDDVSSSSEKVMGFNDPVQSASEYTYDANGNQKTDMNKGIISMIYNHLNQPLVITWTTSPAKKLEYIYDRLGNKLQKKFTNGTNIFKMDYIQGIEYTNGLISSVQTSEGRARKSGSNYIYEYNLKDHLGNTRVTIDAYPNSQTARIIQESSYYPFGMEMPGVELSLGGGNKYLYNGKELQAELGQYDYGARFYDPVIGRWAMIDPMAENHNGITPYNYTLNNPLKYIDPLGLDTIGINSTANVRAGDQIEVSIGQYATASVDEAVVVGQKIESVNKGAGLATGWGVALVEPTPVGEVVMVGITVFAAYQALSNMPQNPGFGDPSKLTTTHMPPSQNPINNPPTGFDPKNLPPGWNGAVKAGLLVFGAYRLYDKLKSSFTPPIIVPRDNTTVVKPYIKRP
ncbi:DUF6443 domain-containing protein [Daejeonella oryzae]|uniref:DUF6443 domain-containing protein n=1 Tax=Daejeonella oryzae TaxID=1122943 RepID=UPI000478F93E|nr:DUF6443 domain-containing protein [Daejeonella oryzae]